MRRLIGLLVPALVALATVSLLAIFQQRQAMPGPAERALEAYLTGRQQRSGVTFTLLDAVRATRPQVLVASARGSSYGASAYYRTLDTIAPTSEPFSGDIDSHRPIPDPPQEVWCVLLEGRPNSELRVRDVVFVALHEDLYNAGWLVHESGQDARDSLLTEIGCASLYDLPVYSARSSAIATSPCGLRMMTCSRLETIRPASSQLLRMRLTV